MLIFAKFMGNVSFAWGREKEGASKFFSFIMRNPVELFQWVNYVMDTFPDTGKNSVCGLIPWF